MEENNSEENQKQKVDMNDIIPPFFKNMGNKAKLDFDYEINKVKLDTNENLNTKMYIIDRLNPKEMRIVNYNEYKDKLIDLEPIINLSKDTPKPKFNKAFCLKRLVSKKKRRFEEKEFDLDMTYVTRRVIAMGYPSTGCESIYRNSIHDIQHLFKKKHNNNVKIYNLCVEKDRIYSKDLFPFSSVSLFPSKDHNPCPIKLILEFCVDLVLYLINNPSSIGAVHCKAGKGRTGVMICSYLVFSGLCASSEEAFEYYARVRTYDHKGVTIPSQRRYVKYFETFLQTNFCKPYVHMIPQIIKYYIQDKTNNILNNFMHDERYFVSPNDFNLNYIRIGPMPKKFDVNLFICNFVYKPLKFKINKKQETEDGKDYYVHLEFEDKVKIDSDIKIKITGGLDFYIWVNLWYSTLEVVRQFVDRHHTEKEEDERKKYHENHKRKTLENGKVLQKNQSELEVLNKEKIINLSKSQSQIKQEDLSINNNSNLSLSNLEVDRVKDAKNLESGKENEINEQDKSERYFIADDSVNNTNIKSNGFVGVKELEYEENEDLDVFQIIDGLNHSTDLKRILKTINSINKKKGRPEIDKNNFLIDLGTLELDKFDNWKKMKENFSMKINYSIHN